MKKETDLTQGSILGKMILFALPLIGASVLQQLFNTADMAVIGRFVGDAAYAAVGSTGTIVGLFIEFFLGFSIGANVVISRSIGANDPEKTEKAVHTALVFALFCGVLIGAVGLLLTDSFLRWTFVPTHLRADAALYLRIYFAGMPFYMLYNFAAAVFRSVGKTKIPFYCLASGGVLNVGLNVLLVAGFSRGVDGVAIATVLANAVSVILLFIALKRERGSIRFSWKKCRIDGASLKQIVKIGLPSGFLGSVFSISNLCVQSSVNSLGETAIAASSAAANVEIYVQYLGSAFAQAAATFIGQNYGAKKRARCKKIARIALLCCMAVTILASFVVYAFASGVLRIFTDDRAIIALAKRRMRYTLLFKGVQCVMDITSGVLQGYGKTFVPACISVVGVCGLRLVWIFTVFPLKRTLDTLVAVYPLTWLIAAIAYLVYYASVFRKWKDDEAEEKIEGEKA